NMSPYMILAFSVGGAVFGATQWVLLRKCVLGAAWWIPITALGWAVGTVIGSQVADEVVEALVPNWETGILMGEGDFLHAFVSGAVGAIVFGLITGIGLVWLFRKPLP